MRSPTQRPGFDGAGFFTLLEDYPASGMLVALSVFVGLLFYVTSADSGALVMANLSSRLRRPGRRGAVDAHRLGLGDRIC